MATGTEKAGATGVGLPQFDLATWPSQILWTLIVFALLYVILDRFLLKRLGTVIEDRGDRIADSLDAAARMRDEAEAAEAGYQKALADARAKAAGIAADARAEADQLIAAETAKAEAEAAEKLKEAEARINALTASAMESANDVASEAASALVERLSGVAVPPAEARGAVPH